MTKSWKQRHLDRIHFLYRAKAEEWSKLEHLNDDRLVYCNVYRLMENALNSLPEEPCNYVCVAMNAAMEADRRMLNEILDTFDSANMKRRLEVMKEVETANKRHIEEWKIRQDESDDGKAGSR